MSTAPRSAVNSARSRQSNASPRRRSSVPSLGNSFARLATDNDMSTSMMFTASRGGIDNPTPTRARGEAATPRRMSGSELLPNWQTQGNAMKVYVRVRPFSEREIAARAPPHSTVRIDSDNPALITILEPSRDFRPMMTFSFTRCFWSVFDKSTGDAQHAKAMTELRDTVDTYLHGGMNSEIRAHARPLSPTPGSDSARGGRLTREQSRSDAVAPTYAGAGSGAAMAEVNVTHPPYAGQAEVYEHVGRPILENTLDGYNGCVFAYGQTGSGKTFTMLGYAPRASDTRPPRSRRESLAASNASFTPMSDDGNAAATCAGEPSAGFERLSSPQVIPLETDEGDDVVDKAGMDPRDLQGIIPRISAELFAGLNAKHEKDPTCSARVEVMYYEVYNEKVFDLIRPQRNAELKIRHNPTSGPYVDGLSNTVLLRHDDVLRVLRKGMQERHTAATKFNDRSSRSHAILTFNIVQVSLDGGDNPCKMQSKLNLVDLAGSERTGAAGAEGHEFTDGIKINLSLTVLGRVIDCLADLSQNKSLSVPVPYRDSNLTWLLSDSLGGNSQTSMIATISPHMMNFDEMRQTLRYASRAKQIVNRAVRNEDPHMQQINLLVSEIERLQKLLDEAGGSGYTREYVLDLERRCRELQRKCDDQEKIIAGLRAERERMQGGDAEAGGGASAKDAVVASTSGSSRSASSSSSNNNSTSPSAMATLQAAYNDTAAQLRSLMTRYDALLTHYKGAQSLLRLFTRRLVDGSTADAVADTMQRKVALLSRACEQCALAAHDATATALARAQVEHASATTALQRQHADEVAALHARHRAALDAQATNDTEQTRRLKELLTQVEAKLSSRNALFEQEKRSMARERDELQARYEEQLSKARASYQDELQQLRQSASSTAAGVGAERDRLGDAMRHLQRQHDEEVRRLQGELTSLRGAVDAERVRAKHELDELRTRRDVLVAEHERQRRAQEREVAELRNDNLTLQSERRRAEAQMQEQLKDMVQQQEVLTALCGGVVADWEAAVAAAAAGGCATLSAAPQLPPAVLSFVSASHGNLTQLRDFLRDKDYKSFRQRVKERAFGVPGQPLPSSSLPSSLHAGGGAPMQGIAEQHAVDTTAVYNLLEQLRKARSEHVSSMEQLNKELYQERAKVRGLLPGNAAAAGNSSSNNNNDNQTNRTPASDSRPAC